MAGEWEEAPMQPAGGDLPRRPFHVIFCIEKSIQHHSIFIIWQQTDSITASPRRGGSCALSFYFSYQEVNPLDREAKKKWMAEGAAVLLGLAVGLCPAPDGLGQPAMWVLGLLAWAIVNWMTNAVPDFVCILVMCSAWVLLGIVPFPAAFASFSSATVWLLIAAMGISAAVSKSGLLARVALKVMSVAPPTFRGQSLALMGSGLLIGPFIPSTIVKVSIVGAMATDIGDKLGYEKRSEGMAGLWSSMYLGYNQLSQAFLSASFFAYIILGLLPPDVQAQFTWTFWLMASLPWLILSGAAGYFLIQFHYRPKHAPKVTREDIRAMADGLGPMNREEKLTLAVLLVCVVFWVLERALNVPAAITAIGGLCVLLSLGVIKAADFNQRISWNVICFMGGAINLANAITVTGIDKWLGAAFGGPMSALISHPALFVLTVGAAALAVRLIIVDMTTCYALFIVVLSPFCLDAGMSPWVAAMCAYCVVYPYFTKYQNVNFLAAFNSAGGDEKLDHRQLVPFCLTFHLVSILALAASVPWWRMLGLIP